MTLLADSELSPVFTMAMSTSPSTSASDQSLHLHASLPRAGYLSIDEAPDSLIGALEHVEELISRMGPDDEGMDEDQLEMNEVLALASVDHKFQVSAVTTQPSRVRASDADLGFLETFKILSVAGARQRKNIG